MRSQNKNKKTGRDQPFGFEITEPTHKVRHKKKCYRCKTFKIMDKGRHGGGMYWICKDCKDGKSRN